MLSVDEIITSLRLSRSDFAQLYIQAQRNLPLQSRVLFETIESGTTSQETAFRAALLQAAARSFLPLFVELVARSGLEDGKLVKDLRKQVRAKDPTIRLEASEDPTLGFPDPDVVERGIYLGKRWTAKILIDGKAKGTGILVRPNQVLTVWHVVAALFEGTPGVNEKPIKTPGTEKRLQFLFDDHLSYIGATQLAPVVSAAIPAHEDWCVTHSCCHVDELQDRVPSEYNSMEGHWDYVVLRLAKLPGIERRAAPLDSRSIVPRADADIFVFQHPGGTVLKMGPGRIADPPTEAFRHLRFLHMAYTEGGASGGPCFDQEFSLFGLHQGQWKRPASSPGSGKAKGKKGAKSEPVVNRGIPLTSILADMEKRKIELLPVDPSEIPIWQLGKDGTLAPVFGTAKFQKIAWEADNGRPSVIVIRGDAGTGKSFCLEVLTEMLDESAHARVIVNAPLIAKLDSALTVAEHIAAAGGTALGTLGANDSTNANWVRDVVATALMDGFEAMRRGRKVWLCIKDLNKSEIEGEQARELLYELYKRAVTTSWLRVILDGMAGAIPAEIEKATQTHFVERITQEEIGEYVKYFHALAGETLSEQGKKRIAGFHWKVYTDALADDPAQAARKLSDALAIYLAYA